MSCLSFRRNPHHGSSCLFAHGRLLPAYSSASGGTPIPRPLTLPCVLFLSGYDFLFYGILRIWIFLALPCVLFVSIHDLHFNGIFRVWASSFYQPRSVICSVVHLLFFCSLMTLPSFRISYETGISLHPFCSGKRSSRRAPLPSTFWLIVLWTILLFNNQEIHVLEDAHTFPLPPLRIREGVATSPMIPRWWKLLVSRVINIFFKRHSTRILRRHRNSALVCY